MAEELDDDQGPEDSASEDNECNEMEAGKKSGLGLLVQSRKITNWIAGCQWLRKDFACAASCFHQTDKSRMTYEKR